MKKFLLLLPYLVFEFLIVIPSAMIAKLLGPRHFYMLRNWSKFHIFGLCRLARTKGICQHENKCLGKAIITSWWKIRTDWNGIIWGFCNRYVELKRRQLVLLWISAFILLHFSNHVSSRNLIREWVTERQIIA